MTKLGLDGEAQLGVLVATRLGGDVVLVAPCWDLTAQWAEPVSNPFRFGVALIVGATLATIACHVGPAMFAARFGDHQHRFSWIVLLWLAVGYLEWIFTGSRYFSIIGQSVDSEHPLSQWASFGMTPMFLVTVLIAGWVKSWWKPVTVGGILLGTGVLVWALITTWKGLWTQNPHYSTDPPEFESLIIKGMLLSAAPLIVIGWRIGLIEREPKRIWLSAIAGVWVPAVVSVTIASLATQAGSNLYWVPSLFRGFNWALLGRNGQLEPVVMMLAGLTLWWPALVSAISLRTLASQWPWRHKARLLAIAVALIVCAVVSTTWNPGGLMLVIAPPAHQVWACSLVIIGAVAGCASFVLRKVP